MREGGTKTARAASVAPTGPATKYPPNPAVMTTGPGVIIATATASTNFFFCKPMKMAHHSTVEKGHNRQAASENECSGLQKEQKNRANARCCSRSMRSGHQASETNDSWNSSWGNARFRRAL